MKLNYSYPFFLCLFFLKGYDYVFADQHAPGFRSLACTIIPSANRAGSGCSQHQDILWQYALLNENDDDDNCGSARKKAMVSRYTVLGTNFFLSNLSHSSYNNRRSYEYFGYFSHDRYIFHRVLRV
ncbi:MAG: hypothetical protein JNN00_10315 [Chitinophagaceae bacterium]|nr:hypothetical protein [Chitinophagaceae bacterium]